MSFFKVKDDWETPPDLFNQLSTEFGGFDLDPAANTLNHLTDAFYSLEYGDDGLRLAWYGKVWLNPPYSEWGKWVRKGVDEIRNGRARLLVALLPVDTSTKAFHQLILGKAEIRFLPKRLTYYYRGVPGPHPARFPSMICVWRSLT